MYLCMLLTNLSTFIDSFFIANAKRMLQDYNFGKYTKNLYGVNSKQFFNTGLSENTLDSLIYQHSK